MSAKDVTMWMDLGGLIVGSGLAGAGIMMFAKKKGGPVLATLLLILGLTAVQALGDPNLLDTMIKRFFA